MKTISNTFQFLNQNPKLRRFLQDSGVHLDKIFVIQIDVGHRTPKPTLGSTNTAIKTGEVTYIVKGPYFEMKIHSEKDVLRLISSDF